MIALRLVLLAPFCLDAQRWREQLLQQAHTRLIDWYNDPSLMQVSSESEGVMVNIMKKDRGCGGSGVPVTFASFDVAGARPVDVFNAMVDTEAQREWNSQCKSVTEVGQFEQHGARGWSVIFGFPLGGDREFLQWQAASADFENEEFWLVYSTMNNDALRDAHPLQAGVVPADNCLGGYHITKNANGDAHVVITQNVNVHIPLGFPLHFVLSVFPPAWKYTIKFVQQLSDRSRKQADLGWHKDKTSAPGFMLRNADSRNVATLLFPDQQATEDTGGSLYLVLAVALLVGCCVCIGTVAGCCCCRYSKARGLQAGPLLGHEDSENSPMSLRTQYSDDESTCSSMLSTVGNGKRNLAFSFGGIDVSPTNTTDSDGDLDQHPFCKPGIRDGLQCNGTYCR